MRCLRTSAGGRPEVAPNPRWGCCGQVPPESHRWHSPGACLGSAPRAPRGPGPLLQPAGFFDEVPVATPEPPPSQGVAVEGVVGDLAALCVPAPVVDEP